MNSAAKRSASADDDGADEVRGGVIGKLGEATSRTSGVRSA